MPSRHLLMFAAIAALLPACGGSGGGGGGGGGGTTGFRITTIVPADGAVNVRQDATIRFTFSEAVNLASLEQDETIRVTRVGGDVFGSAFPVPATGDRVIEFVPEELFEPQTTYSVLVSGLLESVGGDGLGGSTQFSFRTGGTIDLPSNADVHFVEPLDTGRRGHTATLLADGRVLVAGGFVQGTAVTDRVEVFNPGTETFTTLTARMTQPRANHTATRLADGRVLIAGGQYEIGPGTLLAAITAEVFNPVTGAFTPVGNLRTERFDHAALRLPDGRVLVTGGSRWVGNLLEDHPDAEAFSPSAGTWTTWPVEMTHARATHGMVDLGDGRWLLAGGSDADLRADIFSVATGTFTPVAPAAEDYGRFGAAVEPFADGDVAVVGGESVGTVLHFDRQTSKMGNTGSGTSLPRAYGTATRIAPDRILVVGGMDFANGGIVLATTDLVVQGGIGGSRTYRTPLFFATGMAAHTATVLADGRVLFCGGLNPTGGLPERAGAYIFTP